jgi:hypothetical protein
MFAFTALVAAGAFIALQARTVVAVVREHRASAGILFSAAGVAFVLGLIPFVLIYEPVYLSLPGPVAADFNRRIPAGKGLLC